MMKTNKSTIQSGVRQLSIFNDEERHGLYKTIFHRRDVRSEFMPDPVPEDMLSRILYAAHHAPSVGFMQPWNFIMVTDDSVKQQIYEAFIEANTEAITLFQDERQEQYRSLRLEGILESPVNICVTCDRNRTGPVVLGRTHNKMMDMYSTVCAVQNLWLAARTEGLGVGWVSIFKKKSLQKILQLPKHVIPIAYLCIGYVSHFNKAPDLEAANWLPRLALEDLISFNQWDGVKSAEESDLIKQVIQDKGFPQNF